MSLSLVSGNDKSSLKDVKLNQCGINSLYLCLKYNGIETNLDQIYSDIEPDADNNVSLKQLAGYAKRNGLYIKPVIKPSCDDVKKYLSKDTSIILQYALDLPNESNFKHIIAIVMSANNNIFLLDYPKPAFRIEMEEIAGGITASEGMLVLSKKPVNFFSRLFDFQSVQSWFIFPVCLSVIAVCLVTIIYFKHKRVKKI